MDGWIVGGLGAPIGAWAGFFAVFAALLALDLGILGRRASRMGIKGALGLSAAYILIGLGFSWPVGLIRGEAAAVDYLTAYVVEKSLSIDNIFVIALIFTQVGVPPSRQRRVLFWGVLGVVILRGIVIGAGAALVARFHVLLDLFALFLLFTGAKILWVGQAGMV